MHIQMIKSFLRDEDGASAFDWKALSALVVGGGLIVGGYTYSGSEGATTEIVETLEDENLPDQIFPGRAIAY